MLCTSCVSCCLQTPCVHNLLIRCVHNYFLLHIRCVHNFNFFYTHVVYIIVFLMKTIMYTTYVQISVHTCWLHMRCVHNLSLVTVSCLFRITCYVHHLSCWLLRTNHVDNIWVAYMNMCMCAYIFKSWALSPCCGPRTESWDWDIFFSVSHTSEDRKIGETRNRVMGPRLFRLCFTQVRMARWVVIDC